MIEYEFLLLGIGLGAVFNCLLGMGISFLSKPAPSDHMLAIVLTNLALGVGCAATHGVVFG